MPVMAINGVNLHYELAGSGPPLVFIGGLGSDISELGRLIAPLAEHFTVLAFDNRGAGRSDKPDIP